MTEILVGLNNLAAVVQIMLVPTLILSLHLLVGGGDPLKSLKKLTTSVMQLHPLTLALCLQKSRTLPGVYLAHPHTIEHLLEKLQ